MNTIRTTIENSLAMAKDSQVPFLLMGPFGFGKTTQIKHWAADNGYHCEILNGARFEAEAIEGYQVNEPGSDSLVHKNPSWFERIWQKEKEGIRSVLFCDELSGGRVQTQNALLNLLDDGRTIGEGKKLPKSTIVIAASNYYDNVPDQCTITSGNLNRFCIINMLDGMTQADIVDEFFDDEEEKLEVKDKKFEMSDSVKSELNTKLKNLFKEVIKQYSDPDSSKGFIDMRFPNVKNLYEEAPQGELYNFISGRTMSFTKRVLTSYITLGIEDFDYLKKCLKGLVGVGSGHFVNKAQITSFNSVFENSIKTIISEITRSAKEKIGKEKFSLYGKEDISTKVNMICSFSEETQNLVGNTSKEKEDLKKELAKLVSDKYMTVAETLFKIENDSKFKSEFFTDFESIFELLHKESKVPAEIVTFAQVYDAYYSQLIGKQLFPNVTSQGAFKNYPSSLYRCSILALKDGEELPKTSKEFSEYVKYEKIIQVGITQNYSKKLYKMLYNSKVHGDAIFDVVENYSPIIFNKEKKLEVKDWPTLREEAMTRS